MAAKRKRASSRTAKAVAELKELVAKAPSPSPLEGEPGVAIDARDLTKIDSPYFNASTIQVQATGNEILLILQLPVYRTIEGEATHVLKSKTDSSSIVLVNTTATGNSDKDPLVIPIKVFDDGSAIMKTALHSSIRKYGDDEVLWSAETGVRVPSFHGRRRNNA